MYLVMHCGGIPFNGDTIKTKSLGGSETAAYYMARSLVQEGHRVILFTNSQETGEWDGVRYEWMGDAHEQAPLGDRFHFYAENTPHDVCIIQRHPQAFTRKLASKVNLWWLHDIALRRNKDAVGGMMWNIDKVLVVSEYHRQQVSKVYGIPTSQWSTMQSTRPCSKRREQRCRDMVRMSSTPAVRSADSSIWCARVASWNAARR